MWLVTKIGFFNIIQYPEDKTEDLLTIKARSKEDLENYKEFSLLIHNPITGDIQECDEADYRFRLKVRRREAAPAIAKLVEEIDYRLTKPAITERFPKRSGIYLRVWEDLYEIQCLKDK